MKPNPESDCFTIISNPTDAVVEDSRKDLKHTTWNRQMGSITAARNCLCLVLKGHEGSIVEGILTSTLFWILYLEALWADERYRRLGYGRGPILKSERLAKKNGCVTSQTCTFSWQD
jgi:hypothetical protein